LVRARKVEPLALAHTAEVHSFLLLFFADKPNSQWWSRLRYVIDLITCYDALVLSHFCPCFALRWPLRSRLGQAFGRTVNYDVRGLQRRRMLWLLSSFFGLTVLLVSLRRAGPRALVGRLQDAAELVAGRRPG
jgi:hypothetical protein